MTGLIHKTINKATTAKLFGLRHLHLVEKRRASGRPDKKVDILTFSTSNFYNKTRQNFSFLLLDNLVPRDFGIHFKAKICTGNEVGCEIVAW